MIRILFTCLLLSVCLTSYAQVQIIGGNSAAIDADDTWIALYNGRTVTNPRWTSSRSGIDLIWSTTYSDRSECDIIARAFGTYTIKFFDGTTELASIVIRANCAAEPTFSINGSICGSGNVTINTHVGSGGDIVRWYRAASGGLSFANGNYTTPTLTETTTYYIATEKTNVSTCKSGRIPVVIPVTTGPAMPSTNTAPVTCGSITLTATPGSGADAVRWTGAGGTQIGNTYTIANPVNNATYSVISINSTTNCVSTAIPVTVKVKDRPDPFGGGRSTTVRAHGKVQLMVGRQRFETIPSPYPYGPPPISGPVWPDTDSIRWYRSETGGTPEGEVSIFDAYTTPDLNAPVDYWVAHVDSDTGCESTRIKVTADILPLMSTNQVREDNVRVKGINTDAKLDALTSAQKASVVYHLDGLSRVNQQIALKASPLGQDIILPIEYDNKGHITKSYLPYVGSTDGSFQSDYKTNQASFYTNPPTAVQGDAAPYSISVYEASPLGRILEQGRAGTTFQPGTDHTLRSGYSFNAANEVRKFNGDGTSTQFYDANKLDKITITDPNGHISFQYSNAEGKVILARRQWDEMVNGTTVDYLDTYYIYDDLGRTKYIISPKGVATMKTTSWTFSQNILDGYTYQFVYDDLGRVIEKKVPGQAWQYLAYDRLDRLVLVQDGLMRAQNKWSYFKYDQQGRAVMQGWYTNTTYTTRSDIQTKVLDPLYANITSAWYESAGTALLGYTNVSFPTTNAAVQIVNYYDSYDLDRNGSDDFSYTVQNLAGENTPGYATGMATATKRIIVGTTTWLTTYVFYDEYGRVIQTRSNNHLSPTIDNLTTNVYDFEGKLLFSKTMHKGGVGKQTTVTQRQEYDSAGRIKNIYRPVGTPEPVQWTSLVQASANGNTIKKTSSSGAWNAGGFSVNGLNAGQDGWVEFKVSAPPNGRMIGFSAQNTNADYGTIDYALYTYTTDATVHVYEHGSYKGALGTYTSSDIFSVERKDGVIYYKKNNQIIYTSGTKSTGPIYVDCSLFTPNTTFIDVKLFKTQETVIAHYDYNELGQLIDEKLHKNNTTGKYLQSIDYRYGVGGELTSINNATLNASADGDSDVEQSDYFGMEFLYEKAESPLGNTSLYNGNISALKWKGPGATAGSEKQRSYKLAYDKIDQLKAATYQVNSGSAWDKENDAENESIKYDPNGNILALQRNQRTHHLENTTASYISGAIDNLSYTYGNVLGDQLTKVDDSTTSTRGFADGATETQEYGYDVNGNVIADKNKGISSITYTLFGKPSLVNFTDGRKIEYVYDASGTKLIMRTYEAGASTAKLTTDYVNEFVYENGALSFFSSPEGRVVIKGSALEYQYNITDHQGNTRVLFTSAAQTVDAPIAKFEGDDSDGIDSYEGIDVNKVRTLPLGANSGSHVIEMGPAYRVGPARSIAVYPGDKVDIEVWEYHEGSSGWGTTSAPINTLITAIAGTFGGVAGVPGESGAIYSGVNSAANLFFGGKSQSDESPGAYVNYILFDKEYNVLDGGWKQALPTPFSKQQLQFNTLNITEPGYVYVYLSYEGESNQFVYFDDLKVAHTPTNVVQYNEYYPYGLQTSASWTREGDKNAYLYNQGTELNGSTGWYETAFRGYDGTLGRFMQQDPLAAAEYWKSPFAYAGNNPIMFNDPTGLLKATYEEFWSFIELALGGYGGTWSDDDGQHLFSTNTEQQSWVTAYNQMTNDGGAGTITPRYGVSSVTAYGSTLKTNYAIVGYTYVPRQEPPSVNLMISFIPNTNFPQETLWESGIASNLMEALAIAQSYIDRGVSIKNLVLISHGNMSESHFGRVSGNTPDGDLLSAYKVNEGRKKYKVDSDVVNKFLALINLVQKDGSVLLTACRAGNLLGDALKGNIRTDIHLFMNRNYTLGEKERKTNIIYPKIDQKISEYEGEWRDIALPGEDDYVPGNISLTSYGTIKTGK